MMIQKHKAWMPILAIIAIILGETTSPKNFAIAQTIQLDDILAEYGIVEKSKSSVQASLISSMSTPSNLISFSVGVCCIPGFGCFMCKKQ